MSAVEDPWTEARRWFEIADEDVRVASICLRMDEPALGSAAYHCQQAAEKLMKGLLVVAARSFRKTHDLDELAEAAGQLFPALRPQLDACRRFTRWGTALRYPEFEEQGLVGPTAADIASALPTIASLAAAIAALDANRR